MIVPPETNFARVFVAFPIPSDQVNKIHSIQQQNASLEQIRWTPLRNLHITLFFLGEVQRETLDDISSAISNVIMHSRSLKLEFEKVTIEGKNKKGGMIWVRFFKNDLFTTLHQNLYHAVASYIEVQSVVKYPIPHITIGRFRKEAAFDKINLSFEKTFSIPDIDACELWQTIQTKEGVIYKSLVRFD